MASSSPEARTTDTDCVAALRAALSVAPSRRAVLRALGGLGLAGLFRQADAKKKHKKKKKKPRRAIAGPTPPQFGPLPPQGCVRHTCPPLSCDGVPDGCGGTLQCGGCPADHLCLIGGDGGVCQPCDVTCTGTSADCGAALQAALDNAGPGGQWTLVVCPGRYQGNFVLTRDVEIIGAGQGDDPANDTILDGNNQGRVLEISSSPAVFDATLRRLRITGGSTDDDGAGILHKGRHFTMVGCTVSGNTTTGDGGGIAVPHLASDWSLLFLLGCTILDNHATGDASRGGGILTEGPNTTVIDCLVEDNHASASGGGLSVVSGTATLAGTTRVRGNTAPAGGGVWVGASGPGTSAALAVEESCRVTRNTAEAGGGGGIRNVGGTVTLEGGDPSPIVVDNCAENCVGPVPKCAAEPVSCPP
jgi:hypothetical protein